MRIEKELNLILEVISKRSQEIRDKAEEEEKGFKRSFLEGELQAYREIRKLIDELAKPI